jgi:hypothetical protein
MGADGYFGGRALQCTSLVLSVRCVVPFSKEVRYQGNCDVEDLLAQFNQEVNALTEDLVSGRVTSASGTLSKRFNVPKNAVPNPFKKPPRQNKADRPEGLRSSRRRRLHKHRSAEPAFPRLRQDHLGAFWALLRGQGMVLEGGTALWAPTLVQLHIGLAFVALELNPISALVEFRCNRPLAFRATRRLVMNRALTVRTLPT